MYWDISTLSYLWNLDSFVPKISGFSEFHIWRIAGSKTSYMQCIYLTNRTIRLNSLGGCGVPKYLPYGKSSWFKLWYFNLEVSWSLNVLCSKFFITKSSVYGRVWAAYVNNICCNSRERKMIMIWNWNYSQNTIKEYYKVKNSWHWRHNDVTILSPIRIVKWI